MSGPAAHMSRRASSSAPSREHWLPPHSSLLTEPPGDQPTTRRVEGGTPAVAYRSHRDEIPLSLLKNDRLAPVPDQGPFGRREQPAVEVADEGDAAGARTERPRTPLGGLGPVPQVVNRGVGGVPLGQPVGEETPAQFEVRAERPREVEHAAVTGPRALVGLVAQPEVVVAPHPDRTRLGQ